MDTCFDWPDRHSHRRPHDVAVATVDTGFQLTWDELEARVARLAHLLRTEFAVGHGDRVALLAESDARYFEIQFACVRIGAIFVPLNIRLSAGELTAVLDDADPRVLVHDPGRSAAVADVADPERCRTLQWDEGPEPTPYDVVSDPGAPTVPGRRAPAEDVAQILYTSGTTGAPKGVMCTNGALAANAVNMAHTSRCGDRDAHALNFVPLFHAGGLNIYCNPVLYWGGRVTTTRGFDPAQALQLLTDDKLGATITNGVLQMFERIAELDEFADATFPSLRVTLFGGFGPNAPATHVKWLGRGTVLQLGYGSTELGPMACMNEDPDEGALVRGEFGRPVPSVELRCVDDGGAPLPTGETGEIQVRGPAVTVGYWGRGRDGRTDDGWLSIGDVGYLDDGGSVHVTGRLVERYRSGGENIYPAEVEAAYVDLPGVIELAVVGVPDEKWGEVGLLTIVPRPGVTITLEDVHEHAEGRLARFKIPHHVQVVEQLPRSTTLKVARNELRASFAESHGARVSRAAGPSAPPAH
ncbi:MAG: AMP-dependent synthetase and ligase [Pseudonocardiales bacterium]|nr:AMP-dependent synthetase and ligase [Pseudonocardiales bacterium]